MNPPDLFLHWWEVRAIHVLGSGIVYFFFSQLYSKILKDTKFLLTNGENRDSEGL